MKKHDGFAIAIAWPETYCKQPNSWYDPLMNWLRISKNHYYQAGHAALILIQKDEKKCHYFDFGRYHSPFGFGRVRSVVSDHDLEIKALPVISVDGQLIENFQDILVELQGNSSFHGDGAIYASYGNIDFDKALNKVKKMQNRIFIPYGPFRFKGSNCSRFVNQGILAGNPHWSIKFKLKYVVPLTPTPLNNVNALSHKLVIPAIKNFPIDVHQLKISPDFLKTTLFPPEKHPDIPENAQWLSGEGAGSWFFLENVDNKIRLTRYSPNAEIECRCYFNYPTDFDFNTNTIFQLDYPTNCKVLTIKLKNKTYLLKYELKPTSFKENNALKFKKTFYGV